jgi:hypothetical protein
MIAIKILTLVATFATFITFLLFSYLSIVSNHAENGKNTFILSLYFTLQQVLVLVTIALLYFNM